jgi:lysophospholipase L1-like esterase
MPVRLAAGATALILLVLFAGASGCRSIPAASRGRRFLALGDSYTIGEAVAESERWPVRLAALLRGRGAAVAEPVIVARTGWTTGELTQGLDRADPEGPFDLVSLLIGVNNQYRGLPIDAYREEFGALLRRAIGFAGGRAGRVLVVSIPDWGVTPYAQGRDQARIAEEIDAFNAVNRKETLRAGARYVDVTPVSRTAAADPALLAPDGLHPSGRMYEAWARLALEEAIAALESPRPPGPRGG